MELLAQDVHELPLLGRPGGQVAARVVRGVPRALGVGDLVDEYALNATELVSAVHALPCLRPAAQNLRSAFLLLGGHAVAQPVGGRTRAWGVGERVYPADPGFVDGCQRVLEGLLGLG